MKKLRLVSKDAEILANSIIRKKSSLLITSSPFLYDVFHILNNLQIKIHFESIKLIGIDFIRMLPDQRNQFWKLFAHSVRDLEFYICYIDQSSLFLAINSLYYLKSATIYILNHYNVADLIRILSTKAHYLSIVHPRFEALMPYEVYAGLLNPPELFIMPTTLSHLELSPTDFSEETINSISLLCNLKILIMTNKEKQFRNQYFLTIFRLRNLRILKICCNSFDNELMQYQSNINFISLLHNIRRVQLESMYSSNSIISLNYFENSPYLEVLEIINIRCAGQQVRSILSFMCDTIAISTYNSILLSLCKFNI